MARPDPRSRIQTETLPNFATGCKFYQIVVHPREHPKLKTHPNLLLRGAGDRPIIPKPADGEPALMTPKDGGGSHFFEPGCKI